MLHNYKQALVAEHEENISNQLLSRRFQDHVAANTQWQPAKAGGTNFCTHRLEHVSMDRMEFNARGSALLFPFAFMVMGLVVGFVMFGQGLKENPLMILVGCIIGSIFFAVGYWLMRDWTTPIVFDKNLRHFWRGKLENTHQLSTGNTENIKEFCLLEDIHAIQLLSESCSSASSQGRSSTYQSYELNLIKQNGERIHVVDHGNKKHLIDDANKLGHFLGVPVWNAI